MVTAIEGLRPPEHVCTMCGTMLGEHTTDGNCTIGMCEPLRNDEGTLTGRTSLCANCQSCASMDRYIIDYGDETLDPTRHDGR